jgi:hypothetical protein
MTVLDSEATTLSKELSTPSAQSRRFIYELFRYIPPHSLDMGIRVDKLDIDTSEVAAVQLLRTK